MSDPKAYTIGWISALELEYTAAHQFLDESHQGPKKVHQNDDNHYTLGRIGSHNVVMAVLPTGDNGVAAAAMVAKDMRHTFPNVRVGLMVGIGGGVPSERHDIRLGDVVVSSPSHHQTSGNHGGVVQYDYGKTFQEGRFQSAHYQDQPPRAIRSAVAGLRTKHISSGNNIDASISRIMQQNPRLRKLFGQPNPDTDVLYANDVVLERTLRTEEDDNPSVHYGLIASADAFMEDAKIRDLLAEELDVLCFEMEAAGLMNNFPCLVVRGICDYSDARWNKHWRGYAAMAAAAYARDLIKEVMPSQLEAESGIGELLEPTYTVRYLQTTLATAMNDTDAKQDTALDLQCLRDLYVTDAREDRKRIEKTKGSLYLESCNWIFEHSYFRQWLEDEQSRLLWVKGDPGKGKTMLLCSIVEKLDRTINSKDQEATTMLSYFFCQNADSRVNSATAVLRGLIYMLIDQNKTLISHVRKEYDGKGKTLFEDVNTWPSLSTILNNVLQDQRLQGGYIIIDALDECVTDQELLLDLIVESSSSSRFKWVVSSRNWPDVEDRLDIARQKISLCLELNEDSISNAVDIYIRHRIDRLAQLKKYNDQTRDAVLKGLSSKANQTFLWVALVCLELEKVKRWNAVKKLDMFPPGLDPLYRRMLNQIYDSGDVDLVKQILAVVSTVYRPVTMQELRSLVEFPDGVDDESLAEIIRLCGSFLTLRDETIYFVHQSAKDFLLEKAQTDLFPSGKEDIHCGIFSRSLDVMANTLRTDLYDLRAPGVHIDDVEAPNPDPLSALKYSCAYWAQHLCENNRQSFVAHRAGILGFLREHLLHWLEALSLMRSLSQGALSISSLETKSKAVADVDLGAFLYDSKRLLLLNRPVIEMTPLQLYSSILIFSPENSLVRKQLEKQVPSWILRQPVVSKQWNSLLQTFEFPQYYYLDAANAVFSPNNKLLASAGRGNIRIWDTETGATEQVLAADATSLSFAPGGKLLSLEQVVARTCWVTVRTWDLTTGNGTVLFQVEIPGQVEIPVRAGTPVRPGIPGHVKRLGQLSSDGRLLAHAYSSVSESGGEKLMIGLWSLETMAMVRTLMVPGHDGFYDEWYRLSLDGTRIVWVTEGKSMLWDTITGAVLLHVGDTISPNNQKISHKGLSVSRFGHSVALVTALDEVYIWDTAAETGPRNLGLPQLANWSHSQCVAMSPDGKRVAVSLASSGKRIINIVDAETGVVKQNLEGHLLEITMLAFSPDGSLLASLSWDQTVRLWDALGDHETTDERSASVITAIVAPDGSTMAVVRRTDPLSDDAAIELWDISDGVYLRTLERHLLGSVYKVVFSPTSKRLLSTVGGPSTLWDLETGSRLDRFHGEQHDFQKTAFSPDGKIAASAEFLEAISLWNRKTDALLPDCSQQPSATAFSPDGNLVALASYSDRGSISLWDAALTTIERRLEGHSDSICLLTFSPNSKLLASASNLEAVRRVKLWDVATATQIQDIDVHSEYLFALVFSPDSKLLASTSSTPDPSLRTGMTTKTTTTTRLWDVTAGVILYVFEHSFHDTSCYLPGTDFSPDGTFVSVAFNSLRRYSDEKYYDVYNVATGSPLETPVRDVVFAPDGVVVLYDGTSVRNIETGQSFQLASDIKFGAFAPSGNIFASISDEYVVELWDTSLAKRKQALEEHHHFKSHLHSDDSLRCWHLHDPIIVFSPNSRLLAAALCSTAIIIWDTATGAVARFLDFLDFLDPANHDTQVVFSPDSENVAVRRKRSVTVWGLKTEAASQVIDSKKVKKILEFSPDGNLIALSYDTSSIWLWDAETGATGRVLDDFVPLRDSLDVGTLAVASGDSHRLAISRWSEEPHVDIWNGARGTASALKGSSDTIEALCFSPNGKVFLSVSGETMTLWDLETSSTMFILKGHTDAIRSAVFSTDDGMIASSSRDRTVRLWNAETGEALKTWNIEVVVHQLAFSPDGSYLATERGALPVRDLAASSSTVTRGRVFVNGPWVTWDMENRLRIPEEYEYVFASSVSNVVTLIHRSGRITFLQLGPVEEAEPPGVNMTLARRFEQD
ncbi:hypothetical protein L249_7210 [Ophiocordyceps polyrhachis-furcata BCC 54312]|uniref:NACHT domain-containing protein n=1 Tax=Ophiocordyceps polyrhachis-furcata BCC 54312 TaxID=1330021 RepID=A0A367LB58_9HYPO|nr:hypothetical protein L249_7210 [Ophiocordyceps polyrhachis-furcata BCC 54312]